MHILSPYINQNTAFVQNLPSKNLHHAYLFHTLPKTEGILAAFLLTQQIINNIAPDHLEQFNKGLYPHLLFFEDTGETIKIEVAKKIHAFAELTSDIPKFIIIENIERMTESASNALLKVLEEPHGMTFFFFSTERVIRVLPTIISRMISINVSLPELNIISLQIPEKIKRLFQIFPKYFKEYIQLDEKSQNTYVTSIETAIISTERIIFSSSFLEKHRLLSPFWEEKDKDEKIDFPFFLEIALNELQKRSKLSNEKSSFILKNILLLKENISKNAHKKLSCLSFLLALHFGV